MKSVLSHLAKLLLVFLIVGVVLVMIYILPIIAEQVSEMYTSLAFAKNNVLMTIQILCTFLIAGFATIIYLLFMFDMDKVFTNMFVKGLEFIILLSAIVSIVVAGLFVYLNSIGGLKHFLAFGLVGVEISVIVLLVVTIVIRKTIIDAIEYKQENELTI